MVPCEKELAALIGAAIAKHTYVTATKRPWNRQVLFGMYRMECVYRGMIYISLKYNVYRTVYRAPKCRGHRERYNKATKLRRPPRGVFD